jgi:predicted transcriptional regulator
MPKKLIEIASEIVQTQASLTSMSAADIASSLRQVFSTLQEMQKVEEGIIELAPTADIAGEAPTDEEPVLSPVNSIQNDKVICLECGKEMRQLTQNHLSSHGMSPKEYRKKYGFTMATPLSAKSVTKARSKAAKKRGLPENLRKAIEARRQAKAAASKPAVTETVAAKAKVGKTAVPEPSSPVDHRVKKVRQRFSPKKKA